MQHDNASKQTPTPQSLEKAPTHIPGLDEILEGGLPRGRTTVVNGAAGSGKTIMGLEFLYRGALAGEPGIFVGFEEPVEQLRQNAATLGWDLSALEQDNRLYLLEARVKTDILVSGDFSLRGLLASVIGKSREMGAKRVVIDALEVALRLFDTPRQVRNEMHTLNDWLRSSSLTTIMTIRPPTGEAGSTFEEFFDSMGDCVIRMEARVVDNIATRRLRVVKYRGSAFGRNEYPYVITEAGLHTAPISTVGLQHKPLGERMPTGCKRLDDILEGGYRRASCILFAGLPGTGKILLASTFTNAACSRGEKVLYISFEESDDALTGNMANAGVALGPHVDNGRLMFLSTMPEAMGVEEHLIRAMVRMDAFNPRHVVIDAISACERMSGRLGAFDYLMRILNACKEQGITILLINQISGSQQYMEISGNGISSMIDTVIFLTYVEGLGETNRMIQVLKSRGSAHSNQKREYIITDDGIRIMDVYLGEGDVLTGTARQIQEARDAAEADRVAFEIQSKELELQRLRSIQRAAENGIWNRGDMRGQDDAGVRDEPAPSSESQEE